MNNDKELCERLNAMLSHRGDGIPTQFINPDGPDAADRIEALNARVAELEANIRWIVPALHVLRGMCRTAGLKLGAAKADEMLRALGEKP